METRTALSLVFGVAALVFVIPSLWKKASKTHEPKAISSHVPTVLAPCPISESKTVAARSEPNAAVMELLAHFRQATDGHAGAKGEADDVLCRFRELLTPAIAAEVARSLPPEEIGTAFGAVALEAWLAADIVAASAWIAEHPARTDSHAWLLAHTLTRHPEVLASFCERLDDGAWAQAFLDYASREVLRANPAAALSLAQSLFAGERQVRLFETIACDWMERDPSAAGAWIGTVTDPDLRERLVAVGAPSYASADPLGAMEWMLLQAPADIVPLDTVRAIFAIWSETAPNQAAVWLSLLPRGALSARLASER